MPNHIRNLCISMMTSNIPVLLLLFASCHGLIDNKLAKSATRSPKMSQDTMKKIIANLNEQCDKCNLCNFGNKPGYLHSCGNFICRNSAMMSNVVCKVCKEYYYCFLSCKSTCFLVPLLKQVPTTK